MAVDLGCWYVRTLGTFNVDGHRTHAPRVGDICPDSTGVAGMQMRIFELWVGQRPHRCMPFALLLTPGIASRASSLGQAMPRLPCLHVPHVSHSFPDALEAMLESTIEANLRRLLLHRSDENHEAEMVANHDMNSESQG